MTNASSTGADLFVDILETYGITHVFGNPGTTELPVVEAVRAGDPEFVLGLHEDIAVGAAAGYSLARQHRSSVTQRTRSNESNADNRLVSIVNLHNAPGTAHGLGNLYGAFRARAPIVVTAGTHPMEPQAGGGAH